MPGHFEKPANLRGMMMAQTKKHLIIGLTLATVAGLVQKYRGWRRKQIYRDFYENYDIYTTFDEIASKGLFQSCAID